MRLSGFQLVTAGLLVILAACTVIIGSDNEATQTDSNDTEVIVGRKG